MKRVSYHLKVIAILLIICSFLAVIAFFKWDDSKSSYGLIHINKDFLQEKSDRLPIPKEKIEGEDAVKLKNFKGIIIYYIEPITERKAEELILYFQAEEQRYQGSYTPLNNELTGAFVGNHYYSSIIEKLGYGWFTYEGNLYADYYSREKAKGKPNYRNQYEFSFVKDTAVYNLVVFCNQQNPEKTLSEAINYISTLIEQGL